MIVKMNVPRAFVRVVVPFLVALSVDTAGAQNGFTWASLKPEKASPPVKILVMGKSLTYYPLESADEIVVTVEGPTTLRVLSRIEFGTSTGGEKRYYLRYQRNDGKKGTVQRSTTASTSSVLADDQNVHLGTSRNIYLKVSSGKHTYRFYLGSKASYKLYLRFYRRTADLSAKSENVVFAPAQFTQAVPLSVKEEEITYYRVGNRDSLCLSVIGPTTIKVLSRLEFGPTMIADQKFRIRILEDGTEKQIFSRRSKPSEVAEYREISEKIVGKGAAFFVEVPLGKHDYHFEILDNGRNVLLRFFIPRKDLTNNP